MIPIRTAVAIRGDFWTNGLGVHDPRGGRNVITERPAFREECATRIYFAARQRGRTIAEAAALLDD